MGKILNRFLVIINIIFAFFLLLSGISVFVSPAIWWLFAFFAIAFPYLLVVNIVFSIFWLILLNRWALLSLATIILNIGHITAIYQLPKWASDFFSEKTTDAREIRIFSYNIKALNRYESKKPKMKFSEVLKLIKMQNPDIICIQEFILMKKGKESINQILASLSPLKYYYAFYNYTSSASTGDGIMIMSKFPILKTYKVDFKKTVNAAMYADVNIDGTATRIFCVHMQSIQFIKENYDYLDGLNFNYSEKSKTAIKKISIKLRDAFILRANQADFLSTLIEESACPVIVCGDFNDTPVSYTYRKMKNNLLDAFRESGHGLGLTYNGLAPNFRIDYILFSKHFQSNTFKTFDISYSDHFPITASLQLKLP